MRGLIYKDIAIFFKSTERKLILIAFAAILLLMFNTDIYAGLFASVMFAMTIGMQNIMSFAADEKTDWKKYQLAMPVTSLSVVASKYASVLFSLVISLAGNLLFNLSSSVVFGSYDLTIWIVSVIAAITIPLIWTGVCLPLTYWFGFRSAQTMGLIVVIPLFYLIKYFEDGSGFSSMADSIYPYITILFIFAIILFGLSLVISVIGYERKK